MQVCQDIIERLQSELNLLRRVISSDEIWILSAAWNIKRLSGKWKSLALLRPKKKKSKEVKSHVCSGRYFRILVWHTI